MSVYIFKKSQTRFLNSHVPMYSTRQSIEDVPVMKVQEEEDGDVANQSGLLKRHNKKECKKNARNKNKELHIHSLIDSPFHFT